MTSIQKTPKLMECTPQSLLACVMTCAQLGLEPDQFLGQAYLVPFGNVCTLIPGYRGYIALARRSGELQTLSAQVVYSNDEFSLQYGVEDTLIHKPALNGRGEMIGAYCVFKYKDGGYSFDWMSKEDIDKIRKRSKAANDGPWVTDYDEMAKKTVIKRHAKLAPLSVEFQKAVALEERANLGESQSDLLGMDNDDGITDVESKAPSDEDLLNAFDASIPKGSDLTLVADYLVKIAEGNKKTVEEIKLATAADKKELARLWRMFPAWCKQQKAKTEKENGKEKTEELAGGPCPNAPTVTYTVKHCNNDCGAREGCPVFE
jgi:phage RecT family recombinase